MKDKKNLEATLNETLKSTSRATKLLHSSDSPNRGGRPLRPGLRIYSWLTAPPSVVLFREKDSSEAAHQ